MATPKRPKAFVVENVPEFRTKWQLYPLWRSCLEQLGYHLSEQVLNAADCGVPQERRRLFVVGVHKDLAHGPVFVPPGRRPHVPASAIINWEAAAWSPVMKPGRAARTIRQIVNGRVRLGTHRFLIPYFGSGSGTTGRSLDRPLGTLTTKDRYALIDRSRMRMLTPSECLRAQGFRPDYRLTGNRKMDLKLIGNAVPPPLMAHVIARLLPC